MTLIALSLILTAAVQAPLTAPASVKGGAHEIATASVQIITGEEIRFSAFGAVAKDGRQTKATQLRIRGEMPLLEFY